MHVVIYVKAVLHIKVTKLHKQQMHEFINKIYTKYKQNIKTNICI